MTTFTMTQDQLDAAISASIAEAMKSFNMGTINTVVPIQKEKKFDGVGNFLSVLKNSTATAINVTCDRAIQPLAEKVIYDMAPATAAVTAVCLSQTAKVSSAWAEKLVAFAQNNMRTKK